MEPLSLILSILFVIVLGAWAIWGNMFRSSDQETINTRLVASLALLIMLGSFAVVTVFV